MTCFGGTPLKIYFCCFYSSTSLNKTQGAAQGCKMTSVDTDSEVEDQESSPIENVSSPSESDGVKTSIAPNSSSTISATTNGKGSLKEDEGEVFILFQPDSFFA